MNKSELVSEIANKSGFSKKDSEKALGAVIDSITDAIKSGDKVQLMGFGTFDVKSRPARTARNPRNGETIPIAASKAPVFKAGKALKDIVNK